jgi:molybdate/tungstate transport system substrate-binding protein
MSSERSYIMRKKIGLIIAAVLTTTSMLGSLEEGVAKGKLVVYHAGSLSVPFEELSDVFEDTLPGVEVLCESGGSAQMISKSITLERAGENPPDIIASADYALIPGRLYEDGYADFYIAFARNEMVLCYRDHAPFSGSIVDGERTWYDVLRNEHVTYGHSNPDLDPCGYRTLMLIQLAQTYYFDEAANFGLTPAPSAQGLYDALIPGDGHKRGRYGSDNEVVSRKSVDLISTLQSGDLDYAFEYRSVATQHRLNFIELHPAINLSQIGTMGDTTLTYEDFYGSSGVELEKKPGLYVAVNGKPIVYGITIPKNAPHKGLAEDFILLLLEDQGREIMESNGQLNIIPPVCDHPENLPPQLKEAIYG